MENMKMRPLYIRPAEVYDTRPFFGFAELTTDEQIAKKIYEATGDKTFKGFLPLSWNTAQIVKMRYTAQTLKEKNRLSVFNMQMALPYISAAAHDYFLKNAEFIKGIIPENIQLPTLKALNPLLIVAGLAAAAFLFSQIAPYIPKPKAKETAE